MWAEEYVTSNSFLINHFIFILAECSLLPTRTQSPETLSPIMEIVTSNKDMRILESVFIILFGTLISCTNHPEKLNSNTDSTTRNETKTSPQVISDTFFFENKFGEEPLLLENETLESVKSLLGDTSRIKIEGPEKISDYEEELIGFSKDNSSITAFNNSARTGMIVERADIGDSLPIFKNNVIIGMTKEELIKTFKLPKESLNAKVFEIYYGEATSYVYLIFESNRLKKILFWPYTG